MDDLFTPNPTDNLLPYDGQLYDLGQLDLGPLDIGEMNDTYNDLYQTLLTTLPWHSDIVTLFGKTHITKRKMVWMGDKSLSYQYSGHSHSAIEWHPIVFHVKQIIEHSIHALKLNPAEASHNSDLDNTVRRNSFNKENHSYFNACLLNYYPSGSEAMGYHADNEKELGAQPLIAALSLGATRKMLFKHKPVKYEELQDKVALHLTSGKLIVMAGITQQYWKHSIPKTKKVADGRISLTFRRILTV
ncbi:alpha-ketoglutarate-dependent dioxygenase AlkB [Psychrobacter sp. CAL346-MNA-CIBAN-0220]|uniref:alpha-ketoglutarate-dependent dioxygenase AlkB family protein n=1 Tax=Psychrobacter sp. CAL346-MNA-CIBAN-0220 TaxID=3140457 RepID=UPI003332B416